MTDTNKLPEPELGYIQTDKSNQPAFSARQMREAMKHALQARAQVQGELEPYDAGLLNDFGGGNVEWWQDYIRAELGHAHDFYQSQVTTPQPAQATQAEVTDELLHPEDFNVEVVMKPVGGFAPVSTQGVRVTHKPTGISVTCDAARSQHTNRHHAFEQLRAILALRPAAVPMTDEQRQSAFLSAPTSSGGHRTAFMLGIQFAEAHHGIKPKEQA